MAQVATYDGSSSFRAGVASVGLFGMILLVYTFFVSVPLGHVRFVNSGCVVFV